MTTRITTQNITDATITTTDIASSVPLATDWQSVKTADFTAVAGEGYFVNTTGGAITLTLPASPSVGDTIQIKDYAETFGSNNLTLDRNGSNIGGVAANGTLSTNKTMTILVYADATKGWLVTENEAKDNVSPPTYTSATGGTVSTSGDYKIHTFNSSSNFVVSSLGNSPSNPSGGPQVVDYLVVAGGAGGGGSEPGYWSGGGGGAGGFRESKSPVAGTYTASPLATPTGITVSSQTYPITVGAGGTAGTSANPGYGGAKGGNGSNSIFSTITSTGGGGGGRSDGSTNPTDPPNKVGQPGGSGGGAGGGGGESGGSGNTPPVSPAQGSNGGVGSTPSAGTGGGGGGATAAGQSGCGQHGSGGAGGTTNIPGSPITKSAGGSANNNSSGGSNTGSGGGSSTCGSQPGAGGSGIVVLRYKYQN